MAGCQMPDDGENIYWHPASSLDRSAFMVLPYEFIRQIVKFRKAANVTQKK